MNNEYEPTNFGSVESEEFAHPCVRCGTTNKVKVHYFRSDYLLGGGKKFISYKDETIKDLADTVNLQASMIKTLMDEVRENREWRRRFFASI